MKSPTLLSPITIERDALAGIFAGFAGMPAGLLATATTCGRGSWNDFITPRSDGALTTIFPDAVQTYDISTEIQPRWRRSAIVTHERIFGLLHSKVGFLFHWKNRDEVNAAIILRRHAFISMDGRKVGDTGKPMNFYLASPFASGHELMEDRLKLHAEFPGHFAFADECRACA